MPLSEAGRGSSGDLLPAPAPAPAPVLIAVTAVLLFLPELVLRHGQRSHRRRFYGWAERISWQHVVEPRRARML